MAGAAGRHWVGAKKGRFADSRFWADIFSGIDGGREAVVAFNRAPERRTSYLISTSLGISTTYDDFTYRIRYPRNFARRDSLRSLAAEPRRDRRPPLAASGLLEPDLRD